MEYFIFLSKGNEKSNADAFTLLPWDYIIWNESIPNDEQIWYKWCNLTEEFKSSIRSESCEQKYVIDVI